MARYVSTKGVGGSSGGSGMTETGVCNLLCKLSTQDVSNQPSPRVSPGFGCWEMICNCPCWTSCYGCCITWDVDTTNYRAYRVHYTGLRACSCVHTFVMPGLGSGDCLCYDGGAFRMYCICSWPVKSCCCWVACDLACMSVGSCVYCCQSPTDSVWSFEYTVCSPEWRGCTSGGGCGSGIHFDWWYKKFNRCCGAYQFMGCERIKGYTVANVCLTWNSQQSDCYLQRMCLRMGCTPFMSSLAGGAWASTSGGADMAGTPCWTIWGIPCDRPEFGTCSMSSST